MHGVQVKKVNDEREAAENARIAADSAAADRKAQEAAEKLAEKRHKMQQDCDKASSAALLDSPLTIKLPPPPPSGPPDLIYAYPSYHLLCLPYILLANPLGLCPPVVPSNINACTPYLGPPHHPPPLPDFGACPPLPGPQLSPPTPALHSSQPFETVPSLVPFTSWVLLCSLFILSAFPTTHA